MTLSERCQVSTCLGLPIPKRTLQPSRTTMDSISCCLFTLGQEFFSFASVLVFTKCAREILLSSLIDIPAWEAWCHANQTGWNKGLANQSSIQRSVMFTAQGLGRKNSAAKVLAASVGIAKHQNLCCAKKWERWCGLRAEHPKISIRIREGHWS